MKKRLLAAVSLCFILSALLLAPALGEPSKCPYDPHLSIMYNYMTSAQKILYDRMYDAIRTGKPGVSVPSGMTYDEVWQMLDNIGNEAPELCAFDFGTTRIISQSGKVTEISIGYRLSVAEQNKFIKQVSKLAKKFANKSEKNGIKAIHDYLVKRYEYGDVNDPTALQSYYTLKHNRPVCNGYAQTVALLCHFAGYSCSYVTGYVADRQGKLTAAHAWNVALINGKFSWFDTTWNDAGKKPIYYWYNLTGKKMGQTHAALPRYKGFATLASILPKNVSHTLYLDLYNKKGYMKGVTDKSGKRYKQSRLKDGQYYAPAAVIWNNSSKPVSVTISYRLDGGAVRAWGKTTVNPHSNLAYRTYLQQLTGKRGRHTVTWYCNGNRLGTFTWTLE